MTVHNLFNYKILEANVNKSAISNEMINLKIIDLFLGISDIICGLEKSLSK